MGDALGITLLRDDSRDADRGLLGLSSGIISLTVDAGALYSGALGGSEDCTVGAVGGGAPTAFGTTNGIAPIAFAAAAYGDPLLCLGSLLAIADTAVVATLFAAAAHASCCCLILSCRCRI